MITINGIRMYEEPTSCGTCPFLVTGNTASPLSQNCSRGICLQWNETHHTWANVPRRCAKLFKDAFRLYNDSGENLVIVSKENNKQ